MRNSLSDRPAALIVEDDDKLATIFTGALTMAGFETHNATDGAQALAALRTSTPVLVVLDLHLPEVSGDKVLHAIRADERLKKVTVILATADAAQAASLEDTADFIMQKPISFTQLRDLAERLRGTP